MSERFWNMIADAYYSQPFAAIFALTLCFALAAIPIVAIVALCAWLFF